MISKHSTVVVVSAIIASLFPNRSVAQEPASSGGWQDIPGIEVTRYEPPKVNAVVICLHDVYSNRAAFTGLGTRLGEIGIVSYTLDLRGFGRWWKNKSGDTDFDQTTADVLQTLKDAKRRFSGAPIFLLGEGIGALVALSVVQKTTDVHGLVLSSPALPKKAILKVETYRDYYSPGMRYAKKSLLRPLSVSQDVIDRVVERNVFRRESLDQASIDKIKALAPSEQLLESINIPTAIFVGERDQVSDNVFIHKVETIKPCEIFRENCGRFIFEYGEFLNRNEAPPTHATQTLCDWISKTIVNRPSR